MRYSSASRLAVALVLALCGSGQAPAQPLVAAVLPASRAVQVLTPATAFVTIINTGAATASSVTISPQTLPQATATFTYQTTDADTNQVTGAPNTPVDIAPGQRQTFVIEITPSRTLVPTDVTFRYAGTNTPPVPPIVGVNTLLLTVPPIATPDVIALAATAPSDGIVRIPGPTGAGAFAVASSNVGASGTVTVSADTGDASLPVALNLCQSDPRTGQCISSIGSRVPVQLAAGATPTFSVFVTGTGEPIAFDPARNRVFVRFESQALFPDVTVGSTSVAVRTSLP